MSLSRGTSLASERADAERQPTGVSGLDSLLEGGFPDESMIVIAGPAGSGKTIFASQFAHYGASHGEAAIYVSFSEGEKLYLTNMRRVGLDFKDLIHSQKFRYIPLPTTSQGSANETLDVIIEQVLLFKAKRLVIDSFSAFASSFETTAEARAALQIILGKIVREQGCTTILLVEAFDGPSQLGLGFEEFVSDGVILFQTLRLESGCRRSLKINKMRGTNISLEPSTYIISDEGITVYPAIPVKTVMGLGDGRIETGIPGFDKIFEGGFLEGSITALIGATGTGKTTFGLEFIYNGAKDHGEKGLYISFEEPNEQLRFNARSVGMASFYDLWEKGILTVETITPEQSTLDSHLLKFRDFLVKSQSKRVVVDDLTSVTQSCASDREFYLFVKKIAQLAKEKKATTLLCLTTAELAGISISGSSLSSLSDNLILLRYAEINGHMARAMIFLKTSATAGDSGIREFTITKQGIVVNGLFQGYAGILSGIPSPIEVITQGQTKGEIRK